MNPQNTFNSLEALRHTLSAIGLPYEVVLAVAAGLLLGSIFVPSLERWRGWILFGMAALLTIGEGALIWFHVRLHSLAVVVSPDGVSRGLVAVPLWVESEKLFVWALLVAWLATFMRRQREELLPGAMAITAVLAFGAAILGKPFSAPLPSFFGQYYGYLQASAVGGAAAQSAYQGMEATRQYYYNAWFMWVHPPLLFLSYAAFALSFVATLRMLSTRRQSFETTAYRWARFGFVALTAGMLLGFPWALSAWTGEAWWWSGKVNMSLMMWLLYTAYLHARLYLKRQGMWKAVGVLGVLSFLILVLTYIATYVVPGAHSYAAAETGRAYAMLLRGGLL